MPLRNATPARLKKLDDDKLRRESFAFSKGWKDFRSGGGSLPEEMSPKVFLKRWSNVAAELKRRGLEGATGVPELPGDLSEEKRFKPPAAVVAAAKQGLALRKQHGRGGTPVGIARARDLSNGKRMPLSTVRRMNRFFIRHEKNKDTPPEEGNGKIAWLLWGGSPAARWTKALLREEGKEVDIREEQDRLDVELENALMEGEQLIGFTEALQAVRKRGLFQIRDRKAVEIDSLPEDSEPVSPADRKWAIIVEDTEAETNRSKIITARNRTELVRRTKQEARRLGHPKYVVTGGELRFAGEGGDQVFLMVGSFQWKGEPRGKSAEQPIKEGAYITRSAGDLILSMQAVIKNNEVPTAEMLQQFLRIELKDTVDTEEPDNDEDDSQALEIEQARESFCESVRLEVERSLARGPQALSDVWVKHGLRYLLVEESVIRTRMQEAKEPILIREAFDTRVSSEFPGMMTVVRLIAEDRIFVSQDRGLVRIGTAKQLVFPSTHAEM